MSEHGGWANPAPAGLVALAVACFLFYAVLSGTCDHSCIPLMGMWLLAGFVIQVIVGIIELNHGNLTGGNVFLFFSGFFMLVGGLEFIFKYFASINGWPLDTTIDGWAWLPLWITLILWTPVYLKDSPLPMALVILALDVGVFFVTFMDMGVLAGHYAPIAAKFMLLGGICGLWVAAGIIVNTSYGRNIIPMPGPIIRSKG